MPAAGATFIDWQQAERQNRLLIDEEFTWLELPRRRRRRAVQPVRDRAAQVARESDAPATTVFDAPPSGHGTAPAPAPRTPVAGEPVSVSEPVPVRPRLPSRSARPHPRGVRAPRQQRTNLERSFDLADRGGFETPAKRTVRISGRGAERYAPIAARARTSALRLHERSGFSPDRAGLWAVLLGIVLVLACVVH